MNKFQTFLTIVFLFATVLVNGQNGIIPKPMSDSIDIVFKDTIFNIAFDSLSHNLGLINPINENNRLVKHFKYLGTDTIFIVRAWTGDPHFICSYPKEPLVPNKIYSFSVCFWHKGKQGKTNKAMGFNLSDGNRVTIRFKGEYCPIEINE